MRIRYTLPASADLDAALAFLAFRSPGAARKLIARLDAIEALLTQFPNSGSPTRVFWLRRCVLSPSPYLLFYEVSADGIVVHAIRHAARDPASMPDEA